jgi:hypothetical protein
MRVVFVILAGAATLAACGGSDETVRGYVVAPEGEPIRLCEALLESYPPQCGEPSLVVRGLDLAKVPGLVSTDDPALARVSWSERPVELAGTVEDGILTVG